MSPRKSLAGAFAAVAALVVLAPPAFAHVTVNPGQATKGGFTKLAFQVPNEDDAAGTVKLEVKLPTELDSARVRPKIGWEADVTSSTITWTAEPGTRISPGEFDEFEISVGPLPDDADELVFPAIQTYDNGDEVEWIELTEEGEAEPEHPAPVLTLVEGAAEGDGHSHDDEGDVAGDQVADTHDDGGTDGVAVAGLIVGIVALLVGGAALFRGRRPTA